MGAWRTQAAGTSSVVRERRREILLANLFARCFESFRMSVEGQMQIRKDQQLPAVTNRRFQKEIIQLLVHGLECAGPPS